MPHRIPIRLKLTAALAIPISALLVVAALEVVQTRADTRDVREQTNLAEAALGPAGLTDSLENERNYGSLWILGSEGAVELPVKDFADAVGKTDEAIRVFRDSLESKGGDVAETYAPAFEALDRLGELRRTVTEYDLPTRGFERQPVADPMFQGYTEIIHTVFDANTRAALAIDDQTLRRGAELSDLASRQKDAIARLVRYDLLIGIQNNGKFREPQEFAEAAALYGEVLSNQNDIRSLGDTRPYRAITRRLAEESDSTGFLPLARQILDTGEVPIPELLGTVSVDKDFSYYGYQNRLRDVIGGEVDRLTSAANARQRWYLSLALLAIVLAIIITWIISRSITQPLRSLTRQAQTMADQRLPDAVLDILETPLGENVQVPDVEPIRVRTRDEVSDVAEALNTVQDSALDLAVEQAVLRRNIADSFVNLGRRNQNLLGRQLDFITELESNETDPDTLASLFRLDHLATRMRRNAESLLVLAGVEPPRKWAAPVRITDVIRAALGEVEDYQRVTVRGVEAATVVGSAAADLAHLIAEFVENALTFSPPDQNVDIRGGHRPGSYTLAIIDSGLGMPAADITQANRRLAGAESFTIAPSKYLGHYVAGNLAARHGIRLQLDNSPGNGITATIELPPSMLTTEAPTNEPITDPHANRVVSLPMHGADAAPMAAGPALPSQMAAAAPPPSLAVPASRTASGLVKRASRAAPARATNVPDDDLLATLSTYARTMAPPLDPILPGTPGPMSSLTASPPFPPRSPEVPPAGHVGPVHRVPPSQPAPPPWGPPAMPADGPAGYAAPVPGGPAPAGYPAPIDPGLAGGTPGGDVWASLAALDTGPRPAVADVPWAHTGPAEPPRPPLDPAVGGTTTSGLARRVRGAQLPMNQPLTLRRTRDDAGSHRGDYGRDDNGAGSGHGDAGSGAANDDRGPAKDVYSFLSGFTAGVQRGLDEARRDTERPEDES